MAATSAKDWSHRTATGLGAAHMPPKAGPMEDGKPGTG
jgi:hypothetical protein